MAAKTVKEDFASRQKQLNDQLRNGDLRRVYLLGENRHTCACRTGISSSGRSLATGMP